MSLGENMKKRREALKLSQEYVAAQLGVSRQAVSKWETGQSEPTASNLIRLAQVLETTLTELVEPHKADGAPAAQPPAGKKPNPILRANLIKIAITAQAAWLFNCTTMLYQLRQPDFPNKELYRGGLAVSLVLLGLSSVWMAANHRYEPDLDRRRKNARIELVYCCIQLGVALLTVHFGLGLVGAAGMIAVASVYILYINPKYMARKLTK